MKKRIIIAIIITIILSSLCLVNYLTKETYDMNKEINKCMEQNNSSYRVNNGKVYCYITNYTTTNTTTTTKKTTKKKTTKNIIKTTMKEGTYKLTHYGWDCKGCGGNTASGYNVRNTIYYNDVTYSKLRIAAMKDLPLYSVIKIKNYDGRDIFAIVLDRGVGSGVIDLLVENEKTASKLGIRKNIEIEVLRYGKN